jgi:hypothetical protein
MPGRIPGRPPGRPPQPAPQPAPPQPAPPPHPAPGRAPGPPAAHPPPGPVRHADQGALPTAPAPLSSPEPAGTGQDTLSYDPVPCIQGFVGDILYGTDPYEALVNLLVCLQGASQGQVQPLHVGAEAHRRTVAGGQGRG